MPRICQHAQNLRANLSERAERADQFYFQWQYEYFNGTASIPINWIVKNTRLGKFVGTGVSSLPLHEDVIWGGEATYWGAGNSEGVTTLTADRFFSAPTVSGFRVLASGSHFPHVHRTYRNRQFHRDEHRSAGGTRFRGRIPDSG